MGRAERHRPPLSLSHTLPRMTSGLHRYHASGDLHSSLSVVSSVALTLVLRQAAPGLKPRLKWSAVAMALPFLGYVVMPEHVHLLINEPARGALSTALQALKISVSRRSGEHPFWQARYFDFNVFSASKITEKLRYLHRNPVKRGLVERPEDWPWSSYCHYAFGAEGTVEIESFRTAARRGFRTMVPLKKVSIHTAEP
jgi:putative transposase